ncbi:MAG: phosphoglucosamine mutase [Planctomycetes bacterium]|nr:phosphoglucosamine mutase [Planctomycetota bacterium]
MTRKLFGTDGIRGKAGQEPLTPTTLERFGFALAQQLGSGALVIGHDGRESGETLVAALAMGLSHGGVNVDVVGLTTTPCVAYLTAAGDYLAGIMVSASHNPAPDNGIKLLDADGGKLCDEREIAVEKVFFELEDISSVENRGEVRRANNLLGDYVGWLRTEAFPDLDLHGNHILVDCANGGASQLATRVLHAFGGEAVCIHDKPDGRNINEGCGALHPEVAAEALANTSCNIGISLDGDGDRGMLVARGNRVLDGDYILAGLGASLGEIDALPGKTVVATVMSNLALENYLGERGLRLDRTQVGDRYVAAEMKKGGYLLGGEKSGHILFGDEHGYRGDGLYTLLKILNTLSQAGQKIEDFAAGYADMPQTLLNLDATRRVPMEELPLLSEACRQVDLDLAGRGRTVVRFSGTELKLRLMVEAKTQDLVDSSLERLRAAAEADGVLA